jgi:hypothetical protein
MNLKTVCNETIAKIEYTGNHMTITLSNGMKLKAKGQKTPYWRKLDLSIEKDGINHEIGVDNVK